MKLYNTLTRQKEIFTPIDRNLVKMYVCGPTVYDFVHLGNARSTVVYDILYRVLRYVFGNDKVLYVRNITDVDDKIIERAQSSGIDIGTITLDTTKAFHKDMQYLRCLSPNIEPKATQHINDMINIINKLIDTGYAYIADNHVYFNISKATDYYSLSGRESDDMRYGVRIVQNDNKINPGDFVLWKPCHVNEPDGANFESPWGLGRPGWHIECSAMSYKYLGENFDIHGGGADLIFPHHTNEIAQSRCAFPESIFAKYWIHNGFLTVNGQKMSKSLGNFTTIRDLINNKISANIIRLLLISKHYRKPLDFNDKALHDSEVMIKYWQNALNAFNTNTQNIPEETKIPDEFIAPLLNDLNTSYAIKIINDYAKASYETSNSQKKLLNIAKMGACLKFLGFNIHKNDEKISHHSLDNNYKDGNSDHLKMASSITKEQIEDLLAKRQLAKQHKNWVLSDQIRNDLMKQGVKATDQRDGSVKWAWIK